MLKISCAGCLGLSPAISAQFTLKMRIAAQKKIAKNLLKLPILGVQGHSRSSMLTFLRSSSPVLMISSMFVPICNHFHIRQANNSRIMLFKGSAPLSPLVQRDPLTQRHEILSWNTRDIKLSYGENLKSLSHLGLEWYRDVTDGHKT